MVNATGTRSMQRLLVIYPIKLPQMRAGFSLLREAQGFRVLVRERLRAQILHHGARVAIGRDEIREVKPVAARAFGLAQHAAPVEIRRLHRCREPRPGDQPHRPPTPRALHPILPRFSAGSIISATSRT